MGMLYPLQKYHLIVDHALIALDILLEYDLDGEAVSTTFCFPYDTICARA